MAQTHSNSFSTRQPRVVIIGAGMSGLLMGIKLRQSGYDNFRIYEKAARVGGTWRENTYPNVACDVPAHSYAYSFAPNPEWNWRYGRGEEIQRYFERCEQKFGMTPFITFNCGIESARWEDGRWNIRTTDGKEDWADVLVSAVGALHHPRYPDIPGVKNFSGAAFHTSCWDHGVNIRNKRVGVIGTGSTAAQVIPDIVDKADEVTLFQRTAQWVFATPNKKYSESAKVRLRRHDWLARLKHWLGLHLFHMFFSTAVRGNQLTLWLLSRNVKSHLKTIIDPELRRKMTPDYPPACKRLVISEDFYPAIQKENVEVVTDAIDSIVPQGVRLKNGRVVELDILVYSTGFWPYKTSVNVTGENGVKLDELMAGSPLTYRTIAIPGFPNYFTLFGPYSPIGNNSIIENSELQAGYVLECLELIKSGKVKSMSPRMDVALRMKEEMRKGMKGTVWASGCSSWYLDANGDPIAYPYSLSRFTRDMSAPLLNEFIVT
ncbi:flavin-containing monooxygenase [Pseudomonas jessenii]|uniref:flavin-containing monooxygenase n=1 Tax=Pseudomonas jessenii TaxID=77298 RepID=UPI0038912DAE